MRIDILTLFPDMMYGYLGESIIGRARRAGKIVIECHNIRDYTLNKQKQVDDAPYGGGEGMIMNAQPIYDCFRAVCEMTGTRPHFVYMTPQGAPLTQQRVKELAQMPNLAILCGHYEGVDERVIEEAVDEEISVGDYVVTGGELPALLLADAISRLCDGVLSSAEGYERESHYDGLLEYPQYTRPEVWRGREVPQVLRSGHHANIEKWKQEQSELRTKERRPDMWERYRAAHPEPPAGKKRKKNV
ncbi:MAG: tRNA (guanosine(37)-N1)-methyltransferase TrmD [Oscillospiraceae bacterium]|nr:tRNA (guanosine(37)-N1)-methyltransferase TrmD [Oscillospiraceae bacterium]